MFNTKYRDGVIFITLDAREVSDAVVLLLKQTVDNYVEAKQLVINLDKVHIIKHSFLSLLKHYAAHLRINLYNINPEISLLFYLMNYHHFVHWFLDEKDFLVSKREMIFRDFKLCS